MAIRALCSGVMLIATLAPPAALETSPAAEAILAGEYAHAIALLNPEVARSPRDLEPRGLLALALYLSGRRFEAERQVLVLHRLDPSGRDTAYLVSRHLLSAFRDASPVTEPLASLLSRGGADGYLWLGQTYQERGLYADAVTIMTRGAARYPRSAGLLDGLGFNAWKAGLKPTAITAYQRAIALAPRQWGLYYNLGWVYYTAGQYASAADAWRTALELSPGHPMLPGLIADAERRAREPH